MALYRPCAGVVLLDMAGRVWVGERNDMPGAWQMPQGGIDPGEEPRAAALRELEEETGTANVDVLAEAPDWLKYDLPPDLQKRAWKGRWRGQRQKWFAARFLGSDSEIDILGVEKPEFARWRWVDPDEVPSLIVEFKRPVYESVIETFRPVLGAGGN
ncbi:MAG: RNA pyrophosphohydrolase [Alphaproteobacteria bacterium]|nr:RNA pyrophosphohydrolase [Alphaproteobacteria bacterium]